MNKAETAMLFKVIKRAYPHFDIGVENVLFWQSHLDKISLTTARNNLNLHISTEKFPPTIAEISRPLEQPITSNYHNQLRIESSEFITTLEHSRNNAVPPPESAKERMREIARRNAARRNQY